MSIVSVSHAAYSLDLAPSEFNLFPNLKKNHADVHNTRNENNFSLVKHNLELYIETPSYAGSGI